MTMVEEELSISDKKMMSYGCRPLLYRTPFEADGYQIYIRWVVDSWKVLNCPAISESKRFKTALHAFREIKKDHD